MSVPPQRPRVSIEDLARRRGVHPVEPLEDMARGVFTFDDELDEFLAFVHADRQAGPTPGQRAEGARSCTPGVRGRRETYRAEDGSRYNAKGALSWTPSRPATSPGRRISPS